LILFEGSQDHSNKEKFVSIFETLSHSETLVKVFQKLFIHREKLENQKNNKCLEYLLKLIKYIHFASSDNSKPIFAFFKDLVTISGHKHIDEPVLTNLKSCLKLNLFYLESKRNKEANQKVKAEIEAFILHLVNGFKQSNFDKEAWAIFVKIYLHIATIKEYSSFKETSLSCIKSIYFIYGLLHANSIIAAEHIQSLLSADWEKELLETLDGKNDDLTKRTLGFEVLNLALKEKNLQKLVINQVMKLRYNNNAIEIYPRIPY